MHLICFPQEVNTEKLTAFINTLNGKEGTGSHLVTVPPGPSLADALLSSPILAGEGGSMMGLGASDFEFGVDPSADPELALVSIKIMSRMHSNFIVAKKSIFFKFSVVILETGQECKGQLFFTQFCIIIIIIISIHHYSVGVPCCRPFVYQWRSSDRGRKKKHAELLLLQLLRQACLHPVQMVNGGLT